MRTKRWVYAALLVALSLPARAELDERMSELDVKAALEYDLFRYVGLGVAYNWIRTDVDANKPIVDWSVDTRTSGILAYAKLAF